MIPSIRFSGHAQQPAQTQETPPNKLQAAAQNHLLMETLDKTLDSVALQGSLKKDLQTQGVKQEKASEQPSFLEKLRTYIRLILFGS